MLPSTRGPTRWWTARARADEVIQVAHGQAASRVGEPRDDRIEGAIRTARVALEVERSVADEVLSRERAEQRAGRGSLRATTDLNLTGERAHTDTALVDLREVNERMVRATIDAQEQADASAAGQQRAEASTRQLEEVAELREMYMGMLGHDLRVPLGAVRLAADLVLRRGRLEPQDRRVVERLLRSSRRMERMISQLLDLTRARLGGGLSLKPETCDLREVCESVAAEFAGPIELALEGDLTGTWDHDRLAEVIANLTGNAVEYATPGTPVRIAGLADGEAGVRVEVSNQGAPIPPELLPHIFEPFRRAKQREKSPAGNLGLGLYIASEIVRAHGGTIEGRSGGGTTTFTVRLPRRPPSQS